RDATSDSTASHSQAEEHQSSGTRCDSRGESVHLPRQEEIQAQVSGHDEKPNRAARDYAQCAPLVSFGVRLPSRCPPSDEVERTSKKRWSLRRHWLRLKDFRALSRFAHLATLIADSPLGDNPAALPFPIARHLAPKLHHCAH